MQKNIVLLIYKSTTAKEISQLKINGKVILRITLASVSTLKHWNSAWSKTFHHYGITLSLNKENLQIYHHKHLVATVGSTYSFIPT